MREKREEFLEYNHLRSLKDNIISIKMVLEILITKNSTNKNIKKREKIIKNLNQILEVLNE